MKRVVNKIVLMLIMMVPCIVHGASIGVSCPSSVYVGDSITCSIVAYNDVLSGVTASVSYSGMSYSSASNSTGSSFFVVSTSSLDGAFDMASGSKTLASYTFSTSSAGTASINVSCSNMVGNDFAVISCSGGSATISVNNRPAPQPQPQPSGGGSTGGNNNKPSNNNNKTVDNRSSNNKLSKLEIEGFELVKTGDNNYTLEVKNSVTSINVSASSEDDKAKVEGTGRHELKVGENTIEIVVTAENGSQNKIVIKVTRKDSYNISDIDEALKDNCVVTIKKDDVINSEILSKIKSSKKEVVFNYYDDSNKLIYSWILDGRKIDNIVKFNHVITFDSDNKDDIYKLVNYSDGLIVNFSHEGVLPKGTKVKVSINNKFSNDALVNVYYYNKNNKAMEKIASNVKVSDGYITFDIDHACEYFITLANLDNNGNSGNNMITTAIIIALSVLFVLAIGYIIYDKVIKKRHR